MIYIFCQFRYKSTVIKYLALDIERFFYPYIFISSKFPRFPLTFILCHFNLILGYRYTLEQKFNNPMFSNDCILIEF